MTKAHEHTGRMHKYKYIGSLLAQMSSCKQNNAKKYKDKEQNRLTTKHMSQTHIH